MSAGGARRGRRDNGLDASEYAVAGDVDPRVGEHLLDVLAAGGIAAYLQPSSDVNPVTRTTTVPARPIDRLFVDRVHLDTARGYLVQLAEDGPAAPGGRATTGPAGAAGSAGADGSGGTAAAGGAAGPFGADGSGPAGSPDRRATPDADVEAAWAGIIANYHRSAPTDVGPAPWPAAENLPTGQRGPAAGPVGDGTADTTPADRSGTDATGTTPPQRYPGQPADPHRTAGDDRTAGDVTDPAGRTGAERPGPADTGPTRGAGADDPLPWAVGFTNISIGRRGDEPSLLDGLDTFGSRLPDEPEEGYTPPPPPPLPRLSSAAVLGVLAIVAGFILFVFPTVLPVDRGLAILLGFAGVVGGFVTLIWRLRPDHDEDDDIDDGAVV